MKALLSVALLSLFLAGSAYSQGASASAIAAFTVSTALELAATDGDFGDLAPGTTYTITADGYMSPPDVGGRFDDLVPVLWDITGQPGSHVSVSFALPAFFVGDDNADRVAYSVNSTSAGWAIAAFAAGDPFSPIDPRVPNTITLDGGGAGSVQLGGVIAVPQGANSASYTATFVLTASYTGL